MSSLVRQDRNAKSGRKTAAQTFMPSLVDRYHHKETHESGDPQRLQEALIASGRLGDPNNFSAYAVAMTPLLMALNWKGQFRQLCEALPQREVSITEAEIRNILARLNFISDKVCVPLRDLDERLIPCLYTTDDGVVYSVLAKDEYGVTVFNTGLDHADVISHDDHVRGEAIVFYNTASELLPDHLHDRLPRKSDKTRWSLYVFRRFSGLFKQALVMSFMVNLLGLSVPFLVMATLGIVVSTHNLHTLAWFCLGGVVAVSAEVLLRSLRGKIMTTVSVRLDYIFSNEIFERVLKLPLPFTENSTVSAQVARLRDYMSVGQFLRSPLSIAFLDLPFIFLLLGAMAFFSLKMAGLTVLALAIFGVISLSTKQIIRRSIVNSADSNIRKQEMLLETLENREMFLQTNSQDAWLMQYRECCGRAAKSSMKTSLLGSLLETCGYMITMMAGVAIVSFGILDVLNGSMQVGALVGAIILLWKIINPIQSVLSNLPKFEQLFSSLKQIDRLMDMDTEHVGHIDTEAVTRFSGRIILNRVSLRHAIDSDPALLGIDLETNSGDMIAITGENGSGKSTLFKAILGLYKPQAGQIQIDGIDIRQMNPSELRHAIGYMPQKSSLLPGTIASNLRLADPTATTDDMCAVMALVQGLDAINALPLGFETKIIDENNHEIPDSLSQKIALARAMIGKPGIMLIDEIEGIFTEPEKIKFLQEVEIMEDRPTVLFATQDDVIMKACSRVLVFKGGELMKAGDMPVLDNESVNNGRGEIE